MTRLVLSVKLGYARLEGMILTGTTKAHTYAIGVVTSGSRVPFALERLEDLLKMKESLKRACSELESAHVDSEKRPSEVFHEVSKEHGRKLNMKEIKRELEKGF